MSAQSHRDRLCPTDLEGALPFAPPAKGGLFRPNAATLFSYGVSPTTEVRP
jgi:hypothetical protein